MTTDQGASRTWDFNFLETLKHLQECPDRECLKPGHNMPLLTAVIVLNHDLPTYAVKLLEQASVILCADGGADRLVACLMSSDASVTAEALRERLKHCRAFQQHALYIVGDMDSISPATVNLFKQLRVSVQPDQNQNSTDLHKCLALLRRVLPAQNGSEITKKNQLLNLNQHLRQRRGIFILGNIHGRLDHTIANIGTLYQQNHFKKGNFQMTDEVYLLDEVGLCCLLEAGRHTLMFQPGLAHSLCSLLPLQPVRAIWTTGLKWNLEGKAMSISGLISSSNQLVASQVTIEVSDAILWYACPFLPVALPFSSA